MTRVTGVISRALSVRETETLVKRAVAPPASQAPAKGAAPNDVHTRAAEDRLRFALGTKVRIVRRGNGGVVEIAFTSESELQRLYEQLTGAGR